jgi:hypothetical protein
MTGNKAPNATGMAVIWPSAPIYWMALNNELAIMTYSPCGDQTRYCST